MLKHIPKNDSRVLQLFRKISGRINYNLKIIINPQLTAFFLPKYSLSLKNRFANFLRGTLKNPKIFKIDKFPIYW